MDEQVFTPEPAQLRTEIIYSVIGGLVFIPGFMWWNDVPWYWAPPLIACTMAFVLGKDIYKVRYRGRDVVQVSDAGVRVSNRRKVWTMGWAEIFRVYRYKDQLIFETHGLHRRQTLELDGHGAHKKELVAAIVERARSMNLAALSWVETLLDLF